MANGPVAGLVKRACPELLRSPQDVSTQDATACNPVGSQRAELDQLGVGGKNTEAQLTL